MAKYKATLVGNAIIVTIPFSAIAKSIKINPGDFGADRMDVIDIRQLAAEMVASINGSNAIESTVICEAGEAMDNGTKALVLHRNAIAA
jgi:hypothetical protein